MKTRRELLAGLSATIVLAGCTGDGNENGTTPPGSSETRHTSTSTPSDTTTPTDTETATDTPTETPPEDTPTETPPEETPTDTPGPTPEPEPEKEFEEIYREEMFEVTNISGVVGEQVDWQQVRNELEEDGHQPDNPTVSSEFIEDLAGHAGKQVRKDYGAAALAYGLHEEFGITTDEVIVDARTYNSGQQAAMASILIKQSDGGVVKDLYAPFGDGQRPDQQGDVLGYQRHDEPNPQGAEQTITDAWTNGEGVTAGLKISEWLRLSEKNDRWDRGTWEALDEVDDQIIVGYNHDNEGKVVYTMDGAMATEETVNPDNINENPETVGVQARNLVVGATEFYHNNVKDVEGAYMEIDYDGQDFQFDVVDEERHNELEVNYGE